MKQIVAIGEVLIDFAPDVSGKPIKETAAFLPNIGGAPANVCGAYVKLGGRAVLLTQVGNDLFGDKIVEELSCYGVDTSHIKRTDEANTSLAFVALGVDGTREFAFFRKPGADMLYRAEDVPKEVFKDAYALHFCSVSLGDFPMREAHRQAIRLAKKAGALISFDPNLRKQLWKSEKDLKAAVLEFMPCADILKLSDEEVQFITGHERIEEALQELFGLGISAVVYTMGRGGACVYTPKTRAQVPGNGITPVDTTGAGDGFIGSLLNQLAGDDVNREKLQELTAEQWVRYLHFSDAFCGISIQKKGAIASYAARGEFEA